MAGDQHICRYLKFQSIKFLGPKDMLERFPLSPARNQGTITSQLHIIQGFFKIKIQSHPIHAGGSAQQPLGFEPRIFNTA